MYNLKHMVGLPGWGMEETEIAASLGVLKERGSLRWKGVQYILIHY